MISNPKIKSRFNFTQKYLFCVIRQMVNHNDLMCMSMMLMSLVPFLTVKCGYQELWDWLLSQSSALSSMAVTIVIRITNKMSIIPFRAPPPPTPTPISHSAFTSNLSKINLCFAFESYWKFSLEKNPKIRFVDGKYYAQVKPVRVLWLCWKAIIQFETSLFLVLTNFENSINSLRQSFRS